MDLISPLRRSTANFQLMLHATVNGKFTFDIQQEEGKWIIGNNQAAIDISEASGGVLSVLYNGKSYEAIVQSVDRKAKELKLSINGQSFNIAIQEPIDTLLHELGLDLAASKKVEPIKAPMPGMVLKVLVEPGQRLEKGDGILILEAMKMENVLKAPAAATVKSIRIEERTAVGKGDVLIDLE
jgi:biotin carboxyl carrier protein